MLRIGVCDDDKEFRQRLMQMIRIWSDHGGIPTELYPFGDELIAKNAAFRMDIILLDIVMPLLNGMDTARELRAQDTAVKIIFLTSSPEFALESYEVRAQDYLLKPITRKDIAALIERLNGILKPQALSLRRALEDCSHLFEAEPKNMVLKTSFGFQKLYFHDIEYAEAQNKRVVFYLRGDKVVETSEPLRSFEERLTVSSGFFKCHRSYLVYLPNVDHFNNNEIFTKSGRSIPIARGYGKAFQEAYFAHMFQEE